ncbi:uncharacterized protein [Procambarus clarkii]|uniref:uncharacterized protein isoform X1 n=1 Tax=Procambarus clarkii TaxID=6728 RepID=UPI00374296F8
MPPLKRLSSLREICAMCVWQWLLNCGRHQAVFTSHFSEQRKYLVSALSPLLRQRLLTIILNMNNNKLFMETKCKLLQALGDDTTQWVDITRGGAVFYDEMLCFYSTVGLVGSFNLTRLGAVCDARLISDQKYISAVNSTFYWALKKMHNLIWITLGGIADDTILKIVGTNCPQLQHLDVSSSLKVDDEGVAALILKNPQEVLGLSPQQVGRKALVTNSCCTTLNFVCVSNTQVSAMGAALLLHCVPGLTSLGGYINACSLTSVIELLQPEDGITQFKLNQLWDLDILPREASLLREVCQNIAAITTNEASLAALHLVLPFESLSVEADFKNTVDSLYNYLAIRGEVLKQLIITDSINCPLDLMWLIELTPNLERIEATLEAKQENVIPTWNDLREASVTVASSITIVTLLTHTPNLCDLNLTFLEGVYNEESYKCINDELLLLILMAGGLKKVEKLKIDQCMISPYGLDLLLLHCPDLQYLAPLVCWPNITQDEVDKLHAKAAQNNWVLKIVMRSD